MARDGDRPNIKQKREAKRPVNSIFRDLIMTLKAIKTLHMLLDISVAEKSKNQFTTICVAPSGTQCQLPA